MTDLAQMLADFAEEMEAADGLEATGLVVAHAAQRLIPGVEDASISLARRRVGIDTLASTSQLPREADKAQVATGQGPCIEAAWEERVAHLRDTSTDPQWPEYSKRAHDLGIGSMLSLQLSLDDPEERIGALNTYNRQAAAYDPRSVQIGRLVAVHASVGLAGASRLEQLQQAVTTRDVIGQAKGILMAEHNLDAESAFDVLVRHSRDTNVRLRELAQHIAHEGTSLPVRADAKTMGAAN